MELIDAEVERVCMNTMTAGTRRQYEGAITKMLVWYAEHSPELLHPEFASAGSAAGFTVELVRR